jgi:hypothetical protein
VIERAKNLAVKNIGRASAPPLSPEQESHWGGVVPRIAAVLRISDLFKAEVEEQTVLLTFVVRSVYRELSRGALVRKNREKSLKRPKGIGLPERRFGFIAIEKGFIKADQLYEGLMRQRAQEAEGVERRPLGLLLKDLGYLSIAQLNEALQTLEYEAESRKPNPRSFK